MLRVPTAGDPVWFKAAAPDTAFEAGLYELLVRVVPEHVLTPLGVDRERGWLLLPDGGLPTAMLVPLGFLQRGLGAELDDPRFTRARDAYLGVFADIAPHEELVDTLALACRVAKIARALTWERSLRSAREQDEEIDAYFASAPAETLASLVDDSYLGGG